jgi:nicotinamide-nucleotide amidase
MPIDYSCRKVDATGVTFQEKHPGGNGRWDRSVCDPPILAFKHFGKDAVATNEVEGGFDEDLAAAPDIDALARAVLEAAYARGVTLATAESCTGGLLASLLTDVPGCSHAFDSGFVAYADAAKTEMLGVPTALLEDGGPVSQPVAIAMAEGAIQRSAAEVAVSITGWAEEVGDPARPGGLVHFACARRGGYTHHRQARFGPIGRDAVRVECLRVALKMFQQALKL